MHKKITMKKLLLLSLTILLFSCGDKDDNNSDANQNFLEKYNDVAWKKDGEEDGSNFWLKFTPNSITDCQEDGSDCDCGVINWNVVDSDGDYISVTENLPEKLVLSSAELNATLTTINNGNGIEIRFSADGMIRVETYTRVSETCSDN